jgi:DtxR family Mn-dependent transcriptional regulator
MALFESGEMYLETILILSKQKKDVRAMDIAEHMNFSKPSVSRALGLLESGGYITRDSDNLISFTEAGLELSEKIYERHMVIKDLLIKIGVSEETADEDACKVEHYISDETFEAIKKKAKEL